MYKIGDTVKVRCNTYKLSEETITKLKEEYGHCLSKRQLDEIEEKQYEELYKGLFFKKEDLTFTNKVEDEIYIFHYDNLWDIYRGYCNGRHNLDTTLIYTKEDFPVINIDKIGKEWDEFCFRSYWYIVSKESD